MEMEMEDSWSLMAIVNECARKTRLSAALANQSAPNTTNTTTQPATMVDSNNYFPNPFPEQFDASNTNPFQSSIFSDQFDATDSDPFQSSFFSDQLVATSNDLFQSSFFSDPFDATGSDPFQNPFFSDPFDAGNSSPSQNSLFADQTDGNDNNSSENPLFSAPIDAGNDNNNSIQNPVTIPEQLAAKNTISKPISFGASSSNSNCPLPPAVNTVGGNVCDHNFTELFKNFSLPDIKPSHGEIEPLQDFREVPADIPQSSEHNMMALQTGLQQLQSPNNDQMFMMPRRNSNRNNNSFPNDYYYAPKRSRKFEDRVVHTMTLQELAVNDKWAWRKYGQKPIKGSPYPRNYYKCSSTKVCNARKQVERSPINPEAYIVTYCGSHQHSCPTFRTNSGPRPKNSGSNPNPPPETSNGLSPNSIMETHLGAGPSGSGSGSGSGSSENVIILDADEDGEANAGGASGGGGNWEDGISNAGANKYDFGYDLKNYGYNPDMNTSA